MIASTGARVLSTKEIQNTLPTYNKLLQQIKDMRAHKQRVSQEKVKNSKGEFIQEQTTNHIAVLGPRGSGKSSVLKTLYKQLQEESNENTKNILLPPIVPENMEKHMTLMSCVLGMLKSQVDTIVKRLIQKAGNCPLPINPIAKKYDELLKTYLRLQEPYQEISVEQYSTETEYLRTMTDVFKASNSFVQDFKSFINDLLDIDGEETLLFVFIDDIDLSAYRCADLVKTLLTYLSHPGIVTVLAGDIEIFGEALILNFLRQENVTAADAFKETYLIEQSDTTNADKSLLNRKKQLAYDYLKKVMPPMYRHIVAVWSLEKRGDFCPAGLLGGSGDQTPTLEKLLQRVEDKKPENILLKGYFQCDNETDRPRALYHLFDETARGLISVYIALQEFLDEDEKPQKSFREKALLEVVVSSNYHLNRYQDLLFSSFVQFGADKKFSKVRFDNFTDWLNQKTKNFNDKNSGNTDKNQQIRAGLEREIDDFRIFVYLDWAARLLEDAESLSSQAYYDAKKKMFVSLCVNGKVLNQQWALQNDFRDRIEEYITNLPDVRAPFCNIAVYTLFRLPFAILIRYPDIKDLVKELQNRTKKQSPLLVIKDLMQFLEFITACCKNDYSLVATYLMNADSVILEVLKNYLKQDKNSFIITNICKDLFVQEWSLKNDEIPCGGWKVSPLYLMYCQNGLDISLKGSDNFTYSLPYYVSEKEKTGQDKFLTTRTPNSPLHSLIKFFVSMTKQVSDHLQIANIEVQNQAEKFVWGLWEELFCELNPAAAIPFYNYYANKLCAGIFDKDGQIVPLDEKYSQKDAMSMTDTTINNNKNSKAEQRMQILFSIDRNIRWKEEDESLEDDSLIVIVKRFVENQLRNFEKRVYNEINSQPFKNEITENIMIDISDSLQAFKDFERSDKGVSNTLAVRCYKCIRDFYEDSKHNTKICVKTIDYIYLYVVLTEFTKSRARYARPEGRKLLEALNQAIMEFECDLSQETLSKYKFWFHCYCRYRAAELSDNMYGVITQLYQYKRLLECAYEQQDEQIQSQYFDAFEKVTDLSPELIQQIPNLFK